MSNSWLYFRVWVRYARGCWETSSSPTSLTTPHVTHLSRTSHPIRTQYPHHVTPQQPIRTQHTHHVTTQQPITAQQAARCRPIRIQGVAGQPITALDQWYPRIKGVERTLSVVDRELYLVSLSVRDIVLVVASKLAIWVLSYLSCSLLLITLRHREECMNFFMGFPEIEPKEWLRIIPVWE